MFGLQLSNFPLLHSILKILSKTHALHLSNTYLILILHSTLREIKAKVGYDVAKRARDLALEDMHGDAAVGISKLRPSE